MDELRLQLRAVIYQEDGWWISHCLEMGVMGHAHDQKEAFKEMLKAIITQLSKSIEYNNPDNIFMPADSHLFRMFFEGRCSRAMGEVVIEPIKSDGVVIDRMDAREFATV